MGHSGRMDAEQDVEEDNTGVDTVEWTRKRRRTMRLTLRSEWSYSPSVCRCRRPPLISQDLDRGSECHGVCLASVAALGAAPGPLTSGLDQVRLNEAVPLGTE